MNLKLEFTTKVHLALPQLQETKARTQQVLNKTQAQEVQSRLVGSDEN